MGNRKKNRPKPPRHSRLKRPSRLQAAGHWIPKYDGKNIVKGYAKHFGVNKLCAVTELEMLGYSYSEAYKQKLRDDEVQQQQVAEKRKADKKRKQMEDVFSEVDSDETFAFIAGYTSGGAPFGITWEEWEQEELDDDLKKAVGDPPDMDDKDLPF